MKRSTAIFLQTAIALFGLAVLVFLLWEPNVEGRNAHATLFEVYFEDAFLACWYAASIFFFVALYQVFKLLGDAGGQGFSARSLSALQTLRYSTFGIIAFVLASEVYLIVVVRGHDDIAGGVAVGTFVSLCSTAAAIAAVLFERRLRARVLT